LSDQINGDLALLKAQDISSSFRIHSLEALVQVVAAKESKCVHVCITRV